MSIVAVLAFHTKNYMLLVWSDENGIAPKRIRTMITSALRTCLVDGLKNHSNFLSKVHTIHEELGYFVDVDLQKKNCAAHQSWSLTVMSVVGHKGYICSLMFRATAHCRSIHPLVSA
jgi:hypothetical protein